MADDREDVYSKAVRAGKRTYFFDVKSTRGGDLFLTITESKKHTHEDGTATYDKHKIFLYKEDFDKFMNGMHDALDEIDRLGGQTGPRAQHEPDAMDKDAEGAGSANNEDLPSKRFSDLKFEDLDEPHSNTDG